jgi:template-activating factor I
MIPVYEERRKVLKTIPKFWAIALLRHPNLSVEVRREEDFTLLQYLVDVWLTRNPVDPRVYTIEFVSAIVMDPCILS